MSLNDTLINNVYNYKYLGINLDSKLFFKNHIKLNNKLSKIQFLISTLSKFIKTNSLIIIIVFSNHTKTMEIYFGEIHLK